MSLIDSVERKFVESFDIDDYEILTDTGWQACKAIHKTIPYKIWSIVTTNCDLQCADTHILFDANFNEVFAKDLKVG